MVMPGSRHTREEKLMCDVFPDLCPVPEPDHLRDPDTEPAAGGEGAGQLRGLRQSGAGGESEEAALSTENKNV